MSNSKVQKGTKLTVVGDTAFAAALVAIGVPFFNYADPCNYTERNGEKRVVWGMDPNAAISVAEFSNICKAFNEPEEWFKKNPEHPFGYALAAIRNYIQMQELLDGMEPTVRFKLKNGKIFMIKKNSEKYHKLIDRGLKPE
jgi:hypothetical protein